jgi:hypothetical protein
MEQMRLEESLRRRRLSICMEKKWKENGSLAAEENEGGRRAEIFRGLFGSTARSVTLPEEGSIHPIWQWSVGREQQIREAGANGFQRKMVNDLLPCPLLGPSISNSDRLDSPFLLASRL